MQGLTAPFHNSEWLRHMATADFKTLDHNTREDLINEIVSWIVENDTGQSIDSTDLTEALHDILEPYTLDS